MRAPSRRVWVWAVAAALIGLSGCSQDGTVAAYRETVLTAFKEVEDNLAALRILQEEAGVQDTAVSDARQVVTVTTNQYRAGTVSYLDVVVAQTTARTTSGPRWTSAVVGWWPSCS